MDAARPKADEGTKKLKQARLILVAGLPGSGKTTLARRLELACGAVRLSADDWMQALGMPLHDEAARARVERLPGEMAERLLQLGATVIIEWGTWGRWERDALRVRARELGAAVELHCLSAPPEELYRRIQLRNMEDPPIAWETVRSWEAIFEAPTKEETALFDEPLVDSRELP